MFQRRTLLGDYAEDGRGEDTLKFRLTYEGPLPSTQDDARAGQTPKRVTFKHNMRLHFHKQLKHLWATHPALKNWYVEIAEEDRRWRKYSFNDLSVGPVDASDPINFTTSPPKILPKIPMYEVLAEQFGMFGYHFVPMVWEEIDLTCYLDVLFLRRGRPGRLFSIGDVDNRMKTLIDCLRRPTSANEIPPGLVSPTSREPFFCLLDDDKYVSHFSVETDDLYDPLDDDHDDGSKVRLIISVELRPWNFTILNSDFYAG